MIYDLLLKGGTLVDPAQNLHARQDVAFAQGRVAAVGDDLPSTDAREVWDARGYLVTPGLIDLHVHVFHDISHYGIEPDPSCLARGATTVVDAGSAGADTFSGFRRFVIDVSETRIFAYLNISSQGLLSRRIGEFENPDYAHVGDACDMIEQHRDVIKGIKVRLTQPHIVSERSGMIPLYHAREAADAVGLPFMVHPQRAWCGEIDGVLECMREGDIVTHCFHGMGSCLLDEQGQIRPAVWEARERGVVFDVGHGGGSFRWEVAEQAMAQGFPPQTISSDLHTYNLHRQVFDLPTTVNKFLYLGLTLDEAIAGVTAAPAQILGMAGELGTLQVGAGGDAVVFELCEGEFPLEDSAGTVRLGKQKIVPLRVVKEGRFILP